MADTLVDLEIAWLRARSYEFADRAAELESADESTNEDREVGQTTTRRLAIVVGHQKNAQGAWAVDPISKSEYEWNGQLAEMIISECETCGITANIFRRDEGGIRGAYKRVRKWGADAAVELHFNSFSKKSVSGTETLVISNSSREMEFANRVQKSIDRKSVV